MSEPAFSCSAWMPQTGLASPICRTPPGQKADHPPDSSQDLIPAPVLMSPTEFSTRFQRFTHVRLPDPHLTPIDAFSLIAHHDGRQPTQHESGLAPPSAGRHRRAKPSSSMQHRVKEADLQQPLLHAQDTRISLRCPGEAAPRPRLGSNVPFGLLGTPGLRVQISAVGGGYCRGRSGGIPARGSRRPPLGCRRRR